MAVRRLTPDDLVQYKGRKLPYPWVAWQVTSGFGKSTKIIQAVKHLCCEIYVPTIDLGWELGSKFPKYLQPNILVQQGRSSISRKTLEPYCSKNEVVKLLLDSERVNFFSTLCFNELGQCPDFGSCEYLQQFGTFDSNGKLKPYSYRIVIKTHSLLTSTRSNFEIANLSSPDCIFIDESIWRNFCRKDSLSVSNVVNLLNLLKAHENFQSNSKLLSILTKLSDSLQKERDSLEANQATHFLASIRQVFPDPKDLESLLLVFVSMLEDISIQPNMPTAQQIELANDYIRKAKPLEFLVRWIYNILDEYSIDRTDAHGFKIDTVKFELHLYWLAPIARLTPPDIEKNKNTQKYPYSILPCIISDANADEILLDKVLPELPEGEFLLVEFPIERKLKLIQLTSSNVSKQTLRQSDKYIKIAEDLIRKNRTKKVLIVGPQELVGDSQKNIKPRLDLGHADVLHFGNLRGVDVYKNHDVAVIIGRFQLPVPVIEAYARAMFRLDEKPLNLTDELELQPVDYKTTDGTSVSHLTPCHPDPRCHRLLMHTREFETQQAIDRLRLIWTEQEKVVYLLSAIPLPDMIVDQFVVAKDLEVSPKLRALKDVFMPSGTGGVIPLNPALLHKHAPAIFKSESAAKEWVKHQDKGSLVYSLQTLLDNCPSVVILDYKPVVHGKQSSGKALKALGIGGEALILPALEALHGTSITLKTIAPYPTSEPEEAVKPPTSLNQSKIDVTSDTPSNTEDGSRSHATGSSVSDDTSITQRGLNTSSAQDCQVEFLTTYTDEQKSILQGVKIISLSVFTTSLSPQSDLKLNQNFQQHKDLAAYEKDVRGRLRLLSVKTSNQEYIWRFSDLTHAQQCDLVAACLHEKFIIGFDQQFPPYPYYFYKHPVVSVFL